MEDFDYTGSLRGNTFSAYTNPAANNLMDGIPRHTEWDVYAEAHRCDAGMIYTPDTNDAHGSMVENNFTGTPGFSNPQSVIVFNENQNYQGISPMDLQPLVEMPDPWNQ